MWARAEELSSVEVPEVEVPWVHVARAEELSSIDVPGVSTELVVPWVRVARVEDISRVEDPDGSAEMVVTWVREAQVEKLRGVEIPLEFFDNSYEGLMPVVHPQIVKYLHVQNIIVGVWSSSVSMGEYVKVRRLLD